MSITVEPVRDSDLCVAEDDPSLLLPLRLGLSAHRVFEARRDHHVPDLHRPDHDSPVVGPRVDQLLQIFIHGFSASEHLGQLGHVAAGWSLEYRPRVLRRDALIRAPLVRRGQVVEAAAGGLLACSSVVAVDALPRGQISLRGVRAIQECGELFEPGVRASRDGGSLEIRSGCYVSHAITGMSR